MRSIRRMLGKHRPKEVEMHVDLDASARSTVYQTIGSGYDPSKSTVSSNFIDYFMILGPIDTSYSLLFEYPTHRFPFSPESFKRVLFFCYPPRASCPVDRDDPVITQFVFAINDSANLYFGICTHLFLPDSQITFLGPLGDGPFCLCSVTTIPMVGPHLQYHEFLIQHLFDDDIPAPSPNSADLFDPLTAPADHTADFSGFRPPLQIPADHPLFAAVHANSIPAAFRHSIEFYFRIKMADPGSLLSYSLSSDITIHIGHQDAALKSLAEQGFDVLFSVLSIANVVRVLRAILLEERIVFVGSDIHIVTFCTLSVLPLLLPMGYKCSILPYLPDHEDFLTFLDSPVPFCFGVLNTDNLAAIEISADVTIVNLDEDEVAYPEDIPHLPGAKELRSSLKDLLGAMNVKMPRSSDAGAFWAKRAEMPVRMKRRLRFRFSFCPADTAKVMEMLGNFVGEFVTETRLKSCRVRDTTDPSNPKVGFVKEVYMLTVAPTDVVFFEHFLQTQTFAAYFEKAALGNEMTPRPSESD
jgi:hypothetical protein